MNSLLTKVYKLNELYNAGQIPTLAIHEVHPQLDPASRENYIYFTLPVSLNFQRSSPAMWKSALATYEDKDTNYLFYPEEVVKREREEVQRDLTKHKLALQKNRHTDIWMRLSQTFAEKYNSDPRELLKSKSYNAPDIVNLLQVEAKKDFPYLSGIKLSNYWLLILSKFTDASFANPNQISIIPDTHIMKSSVVLGVSREGASRKEIEDDWRALLEGAEVTPVEMHSVLWNWSRAGFKPEV